MNADNYGLLILGPVDLAVSFLNSIEDSRSTTIVQPTIADQRPAVAVLDRYRDKDLSFADAISFVVMERLGISDAFAFDTDFSQFGWTILVPD